MQLPFLGEVASALCGGNLFWYKEMSHSGRFQCPQNVSCPSEEGKEQRVRRRR